MAFVGPLRLFAVRAEVRAYLLAAGVYQSYAEAFAPLFSEALSSGLADEFGAATLTALAEDACRKCKIELLE